MIIVAGELDCSSAYIRLRELNKSEDNVERRATGSSLMGLAAPWYRSGATSMELLIPCSYGGRALVLKGAEEIKLLAFRKFDGSEKVNHSSYLNERSANISNALEM
ncbi:hypothetical protein B296_00022357 [Ensete ventricosum]|uniref:Uncharacterized protein n=1 Tax=Ensete ventricosum TaxID=4639 RepID=A0A426YQF4_ENSVE|nr:hypothetical protein B296_00022357 [Ensete ventricosum]